MWMDPSKPPMKETGKDTTTAILGGRQLRTDFRSRFMGKPFQGLGYTGFDNVRGKYFSSWTDDMSTSTFMSWGDYDPATRTYTFKGEMADPMQAGKLMPVRETMRIVDKDHHVMEWFEQRAGKEALSMRIEYARTKR
ncbi:MAG TPA: DUF1579 family protein [Xanthomonadaceae bacterium]|nr:DUF1579 family protein [Xanthomonadaceae bacterium]